MSSETNRGIERSDGGGARGEYSILALVNALIRHRRILLGVPALTAMVAALLVLARSGEVYTAESSFTPTETAQQLGGGGGGLLGLALPGMSFSPWSSLDFYASLLRSRHLLERAAATEYEVAARGEGGQRERGDLVTLLALEGETAAERRSEAVRVLRDWISVSTAPSSGMVVLSVRTSRPELALGINTRLLELVDEFNIERQTKRRRAEEQFLRDRLADALSEMRAAESDLETFLVRNRQYRESPELLMDARRLQREVEFRQNIYFTLAQAHEQARIDAVSTTPFVSVVDPPALEVSRPGGRVVGAAFFGLILGGVFALVLIVASEFLREQRRRETREYEEFAQLWRARGGPALKRFWSRSGR